MLQDKLTDVTVSAKDRRRLAETLQRQHESTAEDCIGPEDLRIADEVDMLESALDRLTTLDASLDVTHGDIAQVLDLLPANVRNDFDRALYDGRISNMISVWTPWWRRAAVIGDFTNSARPTDDAVDTMERSTVDPFVHDMDAPHLPLKHTLPPLSSLTNRVPPATLCYHVVDMLFGYVYVLRYRNGDWRTCESEACCEMISLSSCMQAAINVMRNKGEHGAVACPRALCAADTTENACLVFATRSSLFGSTEFSLSVFDDVAFILETEGTTLRSLYHMCQVLNHCRTCATSNSQRRLWDCLCRKADFLLRWASDDAIPKTDSTENELDHSRASKALPWYRAASVAVAQQLRYLRSLPS